MPPLRGCDRGQTGFGKLTFPWSTTSSVLRPANFGPGARLPGPGGGKGSARAEAVRARLSWGPDVKELYGSGFSSCRLQRLLDLREIVALGLDQLKELGVKRLVHLGRPAQDPEVGPVGMADDGPLVVGVEADDPIVAGEGPEEAHLELGVGRLVDDPGLAACTLDLPVERFLAAGVDDGDVAVLPERVFRRDADAAFLEALGDGRDLVPCAKVSLEVDEGNDVQGFLLRGGRASHHRDHAAA